MSTSDVSGVSTHASLSPSVMTDLRHQILHTRSLDRLTGLEDDRQPNLIFSAAKPSSGSFVKQRQAAFLRSSSQSSPSSPRTDHRPSPSPQQPSTPTSTGHTPTSTSGVSRSSSVNLPRIPSKTLRDRGLDNVKVNGHGDVSGGKRVGGREEGENVKVRRFSTQGSRRSSASSAGGGDDGEVTTTTTTTKKKKTKEEWGELPFSSSPKAEKKGSSWARSGSHSKPTTTSTSPPSSTSSARRQSGSSHGWIRSSPGSSRPASSQSERSQASPTLSSSSAGREKARARSGSKSEVKDVARKESESSFRSESRSGSRVEREGEGEGERSSTGFGVLQMSSTSSRSSSAASSFSRPGRKGGGVERGESSSSSSRHRPSFHTIHSHSTPVTKRRAARQLSDPSPPPSPPPPPPSPPPPAVLEHSATSSPSLPSPPSSLLSSLTKGSASSTSSSPERREKKRERKGGGGGGEGDDLPPLFQPRPPSELSAYPLPTPPPTPTLSAERENGDPTPVPATPPPSLPTPPPSPPPVAPPPVLSPPPPGKPPQQAADLDFLAFLPDSLPLDDTELDRKPIAFTSTSSHSELTADDETATAVATSTAATTAVTCDNGDSGMYSGSAETTRQTGVVSSSTATQSKVEVHETSKTTTVTKSMTMTSYTSQAEDGRQEKGGTALATHGGEPPVIHFPPPPAYPPSMSPSLQSSRVSAATSPMFPFAATPGGTSASVSERDADSSDVIGRDVDSRDVISRDADSRLTSASYDVNSRDVISNDVITRDVDSRQTSTSYDAYSRMTSTSTDVVLGYLDSALAPYSSVPPTPRMGSVGEISLTSRRSSSEDHPTRLPSATRSDAVSTQQSIFEESSTVSAVVAKGGDDNNKNDNDDETFRSKKSSSSSNPSQENLVISNGVVVTTSDKSDTVGGGGRETTLTSPSTQEKKKGGKPAPKRKITPSTTVEKYEGSVKTVRRQIKPGHVEELRQLFRDQAIEEDILTARRGRRRRGRSRRKQGGGGGGSSKEGDDSDGSGYTTTSSDNEYDLEHAERINSPDYHLPPSSPPAYPFPSPRSADSEGDPRSSEEEEKSGRRRKEGTFGGVPGGLSFLERRGEEGHVHEGRGEEEDESSSDGRKRSGEEERKVKVGVGVKVSGGTVPLEKAAWLTGEEARAPGRPPDPGSRQRSGTPGESREGWGRRGSQQRGAVKFVPPVPVNGKHSSPPLLLSPTSSSSSSSLSFPPPPFSFSDAPQIDDSKSQQRSPPLHQKSSLAGVAEKGDIPVAATTTTATAITAAVRSGEKEVDLVTASAETRSSSSPSDAKSFLREGEKERLGKDEEEEKQFRSFAYSHQASSTFLAVKADNAISGGDSLRPGTGSNDGDSNATSSGNTGLGGKQGEASHDSREGQVMTDAHHSQIHSAPVKVTVREGRGVEDGGRPGGDRDGEKTAPSSSSAYLFLPNTLSAAGEGGVRGVENGGGGGSESDDGPAASTSPSSDDPPPSARLEDGDGDSEGRPYSSVAERETWRDAAPLNTPSHSFPLSTQRSSSQDAGQAPTPSSYSSRYATSARQSAPVSVTTSPSLHPESALSEDGRAWSQKQPQGSLDFLSILDDIRLESDGAFDTQTAERAKRLHDGGFVTPSSSSSNNNRRSVEVSPPLSSSTSSSVTVEKHFVRNSGDGRLVSAESRKKSVCGDRDEEKSAEKAVAEAETATTTTTTTKTTVTTSSPSLVTSEADKDKSEGETPVSLEDREKSGSMREDEKMAAMVGELTYFTVKQQDPSAMSVTSSSSTSSSTHHHNHHHQQQQEHHHQHQQQQQADEANAGDVYVYRDAKGDVYVMQDVTNGDGVTSSTLGPTTATVRTAHDDTASGVGSFDFPGLETGEGVTVVDTQQVDALKAGEVISAFLTTATDSEGGGQGHGTGPPPLSHTESLRGQAVVSLQNGRHDLSHGSEFEMVAGNVGLQPRTEVDDLPLPHRHPQQQGFHYYQPPPPPQAVTVSTTTKAVVGEQADLFVHVPQAQTVTSHPYVTLTQMGGTPNDVDATPVLMTVNSAADSAYVSGYVAPPCSSSTLNTRAAERGVSGPTTFVSSMGLQPTLVQPSRDHYGSKGVRLTSLRKASDSSVTDDDERYVATSGSRSGSRSGSGPQYRITNLARTDSSSRRVGQIPTSPNRLSTSFDQAYYGRTSPYDILSPRGREQAKYHALLNDSFASSAPGRPGHHHHHHDRSFVLTHNGRRGDANDDRSSLSPRWASLGDLSPSSDSSRRRRYRVVRTGDNSGHLTASPLSPSSSSITSSIPPRSRDQHVIHRTLDRRTRATSDYERREINRSHELIRPPSGISVAGSSSSHRTGLAAAPPSGSWRKGGDVSVSTDPGVVFGAVGKPLTVLTSRLDEEDDDGGQRYRVVKSPPPPPSSSGSDNDSGVERGRRYRTLTSLEVGGQLKRASSTGSLHGRLSLPPQPHPDPHPHPRSASGGSSYRLSQAHSQSTWERQREESRDPGGSLFRVARVLSSEDLPRQSQSQGGFRSGGSDVGGYASHGGGSGGGGSYKRQSWSPPNYGEDENNNNNKNNSYFYSYSGSVDTNTNSRSQGPFRVFHSTSALNRSLAEMDGSDPIKGRPGVAHVSSARPRPPRAANRSFDEGWYARQRTLSPLSAPPPSSSSPSPLAPPQGREKHRTVITLNVSGDSIVPTTTPGAEQYRVINVQPSAEDKRSNTTATDRYFSSRGVEESSSLSSTSHNRSFPSPVSGYESDMERGGAFVVRRSQQQQQTQSGPSSQMKQLPRQHSHRQRRPDSPDYDNLRSSSYNNEAADGGKGRGGLYVVGGAKQSKGGSDVTEDEEITLREIRPRVASPPPAARTPGEWHKTTITMNRSFSNDTDTAMAAPLHQQQAKSYVVFNSLDNLRDPQGHVDRDGYGSGGGPASGRRARSQQNFMTSSSEERHYRVTSPTPSSSRYPPHSPPGYFDVNSNNVAALSATTVMTSSPNSNNNNSVVDFNTFNTFGTDNATTTAAEDSRYRREIYEEKTYQMRQESSTTTTTNTATTTNNNNAYVTPEVPINPEEDLRVLRGKILIRNRLDDSREQADLLENVNVFDSSFRLGKDNPLYQSDPDIYRSLEAELRQQEEVSGVIGQEVTQDITWETVDRLAQTHKDVSASQRPKRKQNLSSLLLSKLSSIDSKDLRQTIDVQHRHEDIYGDVTLVHADGSRAGGKDRTSNFDSVSENVELVLTQGTAHVIIKVVAERIVPVDVEFNVWRKSQAIVTRNIEIDLKATEQRRRLYQHVMDTNGRMPGTLEAGASSGFPGVGGMVGGVGAVPGEERQLSSLETLRLFSQILDVAEGKGDVEEREVRTRLETGPLPPPPLPGSGSAMDLLY